MTDSFIHSFIESSFPPNLKDIINPKPLELRTQSFRSMFTLHHVSHVRCQVSRVRCIFELIMKLNLGQPCLQSGMSITLSWKYMYQKGLTIFLYPNCTHKFYENGKTFKCYVYFQIKWSFKRCSILSEKTCLASFCYNNNTICSFPSLYTPLYVVL